MSPLSPPPLLAGARPAVLALADGRVFHGYSAGIAGETSGEVVFNTSMFGYQEMLTDPSYHGQILVMTTPHVGNVGVNDNDDESARIWANGLVVSDLALAPSSWRARGGLTERLVAAGVPLGWGFDTRAIVLHLRTYGALPGILACGSSSALDDLRARAALVRGTDGCDLTLQVATESAFSWDQPLWRQAAPVARGPERGARIIVLDCGAKRSILRELVAAEARVIVVPPATSAAEVLALAPGGVVVSNGPGDPAAVARVTDTVRGLLGRVPVLGVCLGHQLLARALGGRTYKLRFGHHGANHPVREEASGAVWITSQNHNYAVDADSLPAGSRVTLTNLTDGSVEGLLADGLEAEGIQFHPEAGPGPHDARGTFARFLARCRVSP